jgi:Trypsin-like peptidase domain
MAVLTPRELYERYAASLAYIAVESADGERIGSAFHVGEGVYVTARHVVAGSKIIRVANTTDQRVPDPEGKGMIHGKTGTFRFIPASEGQVVSGPYFHPNPAIDVAAIVVQGLEVPAIPLGSHLDDMLNDEAFVLASVLIMGYPPVPFSREPVLIAARAEINSVIDKYTGRHPHFVISAMPRGGFSGGVCLIEWDFALGIITESLITQGQATELGFMAVLTVEPIFECLAHNRILPSIQKEGWDGLWDREQSIWGDDIDDFVADGERTQCDSSS